MADFTPIAAMIKPPQSMSLGDMVNIAQGIQNFKQNQQINPLQVEQQQAITQQQQTAANTANLNYDFHQKSITAGTVGGLLADPDFNSTKPNVSGMTDKLNSAADNLESMNIAPKYVGQIRQLSDLIKNDPSKAPQAVQILKNGVQQVLSAASQGSLINQPPTYTNIATQQGQTVSVPMASNPYQRDIGVGYANPLTPSISQENQQTITHDVNGNPIVINKNASGQITGLSPVPQSGNTPTPMINYPIGESAQTKQALENDRNSINNAANQAPQQHFYNNEIINFAKNGFTGTLSPALSKLTGVVGTEGASSTASLQHFLSLQQESTARAMGASTDASRSIAENIAGSATTPQDALIRQAKVNDAMTTGLELYNQGMENAIKNPNNTQGIFSIRDFKNEWSQNFDPRAMIFNQASQEMKQNGTLTPETQDLVNSIKKSIGYIPGKPINNQPVYVQDLFKKAGNLTKLINYGHL